jgi:hypothetical protein
VAASTDDMMTNTCMSCEHRQRGGEEGVVVSTDDMMADTGVSW